MVIEFVVDCGLGAVPIEIKAGRAKSKSLDHLLTENPHLQGFKFGSRNIGMVKNKTTLHIYLLPSLKELVSAHTQTIDDLDFSI